MRIKIVSPTFLRMYTFTTVINAFISSYSTIDTILKLINCETKPQIYMNLKENSLLFFLSHFFFTSLIPLETQDDKTIVYPGELLFILKIKNHCRAAAVVSFVIAF